MEKQTRTGQVEQVSVLIDKSGLVDKPKLPRKPPQYELLKASNPEHKLIKDYHDAQKAYNEYWLNIRPPKEPGPKNDLKRLVDVDFVSLYRLFKQSFKIVKGIEFDADYNDGEPKILVYTLLYYIFKNDKFLSSPLLNTEVNEPNKFKGLLVVGGFGCGKTSIFKALRHLFFEASKNEKIMVTDVDGDEVPLMRYRKLFFAYYSVNDVVQDYEGCSTHESKTKFWDIMTKGNHYYDDLTKERAASNYGKIELFQDILEGRYEKMSPTMASINYHGEDINSTLLFMGEKYGPRLYDRIFEMFNIIEMKGKSLRK